MRIQVGSIVIVQEFFQFYDTGRISKQGWILPVSPEPFVVADPTVLHPYAVLFQVVAAVRDFFPRFPDMVSGRSAG